MQTMEGGVILTNNNEINDILKSLRAHGWVRDLSDKSKLYKKKKMIYLKINLLLLLQGTA